MMRTGYSGAKGNCPRYVCAHAKQLYGSARTCQSLGDRLLEQGVLDEIFKVLEPAALEHAYVIFAHLEHSDLPRAKADSHTVWPDGCTQDDAADRWHLCA
jgi:hypothetical protein